MNKTRQKTAIAIIGVLLVLSVIFIFSNSFESGARSNAVSGRFAKLFGGVIRALFGEDANVNYIVRKCAHIAEFALLGALTLTFVKLLTEYTGKKLFFCGLFGTLLVAVIDEYIQSFTGRTSMVGDILLDFFGAVLGMVAAFLLYIVIRKCRKQNGD